MKIRLLSRNELDFVQITHLPQDKPFEIFHENSKFLESPVFSIFQHTFELSSADFDFYGPFSFDIHGVVTLRNHMVTLQTRFAAIKNADGFEKLVLKQLSGIEFMNALKDQDPEWKISWEKTCEKLMKVGEDLLEIIDNCIDEDEVLWVKGF